MSNYSDLWIVGIGASAGGFESLQKFLLHINTQENITYIITQHLDPSHSSNIGKILSQFTSLKVEQIVDNLQIKSNTIYYCPPNKDIIISNGKFILTKPTSSSKPSIDKFFSSLAKEKKEKAIGIILSGSGNDGTKGIEEIAKNGGITLCEDKNAKHYYMPKSALDTGDIDASLSAEVLAESIPNIIEDKSYFIKYLGIKEYLKEVFEILNKKTNIDFSSYKEGTIIRRIEKRMKAVKVNNINDYIKLLQTNKDEIEKLKNEFFIIVTSFFRDKDAFFTLKDELKKVVKKSNDNLRIWIPACATAQEVYSIAILLFEILEELQLSKKITIFATDISNKMIEEARTKTFTEEEISQIDKCFIDKYFEKVDYMYKPKKSLRKIVVFSQHDIIKDPPFLNIDLISCRNLLIYFNAELQKRILGIFYYSLKLDGLLFLGKSETIGNLNFLFSTIDGKYKIYKKSSDLEKMDIDTLIQKTNLIPKSKKVLKTKKIMDIDLSINKAVSDIKAKSGVVIDKNNNILFYKGDCNEYLTHPKGLSSNNVLYLVKDYLTLDLRVLITQAKNDKKYIKSKKIPIIPIKGEKEYVVIEIFPLEKNKLGEETYFISFCNYVDENDFKTNINEYEEEIVRLKDKLQKTMESLEIANEELRVANEELQSTNEELQSTNEELETSNEELQSTNEELQTINTELISTNADLEFTNKVFNEVVNTLNSSFIVFNKDLNIVKYTNEVDIFFNTTNLENKNLSTIMLYSKLEIPTLLKDMKECLLQDKKISYDIEYKNREYFVSIHRIKMPIFYKNNHSAQKGLVLTFIDKTEMVKKDKILFQQSKMASMGEMIGNIAHQWRQPLNLLSATIMEFCLDLRDECDEEKFDKFENETNDIIQKMSNTIDDFRNFFRPNKIKANFSIKKAIDEALKFTDASYKDNNIVLINNIKEDIFIEGFESELTQVILNILNNSKDAIKENNIKNGKIIIAVINDDKNITISIEDNGGGISENIIDKVCEPYFTTKFKNNGTGLGLYMSKMIIEAMGGKLEFINNDNKLQVNIVLPK